MVSHNTAWTVVFNNGETMTGHVEDGSWRSVKDYVNNNNARITDVVLNNSVGSGKIDSNADGYFLGNRIIALLGRGQIEMVGLGYWRANEDIARIIWFDPITLQPMETEARPTNECGFFLIKNPPKSD